MDGVGETAGARSSRVSGPGAVVMTGTTARRRPAALAVIAVMAVVAVACSSSPRGSAVPRSSRRTAGPEVDIDLVTTPPAHWAAHPADELVSGATTTLTVGDLTIRASGTTAMGAEVGQLTATQADGTVAWASRRYAFGVQALWTDGTQVFALWRRVHELNTLLDEAKANTFDVLVAFDARTGDELWWVSTFDDSDDDIFMLGRGDSSPGIRWSLADGALLLAVYPHIGAGYVIAIDTEAGRGRWHGILWCIDAASLAVAGTEMRIACDSSTDLRYASVDLTTGRSLTSAQTA